VVSETLEQSGGEVRSTFDGLSRISRAIAERDRELDSLLRRSDSVTGLLADRKQDLVQIIKDGELLMKELRARRAAIHTLLVNTRAMSEELGGLVRDNQEQLKPAFASLRTTLQLLEDQKAKLDRTLKAYGPYVDVLVNIVGNGPFFDGYVVNLLGIPTGEFLPGAPNRPDPVFPR
jgi:phospholipid/cholesterol/gamma-HCH transport system substrate-binding protein